MNIYAKPKRALCRNSPGDYSTHERTEQKIIQNYKILLKKIAGIIIRTARQWHKLNDDQ